MAPAHVTCAVLAVSSFAGAAYPSPEAITGTRPGVLNSTLDPGLIRRESDEKYFLYTTPADLTVFTADSLSSPWTQESNTALYNIANLGMGNHGAPTMHNIDGTYCLYSTDTTSADRQAMIEKSAWQLPPLWSPEVGAFTDTSISLGETNTTFLIHHCYQKMNLETKASIFLHSDPIEEAYSTCRLQTHQMRSNRARITRYLTSPETSPLRRRISKAGTSFSTTAFTTFSSALERVGESPMMALIRRIGSGRPLAKHTR